MPNNTKSSSPKNQPTNLEAEISLLGSILIDNDAIVKIADQLLADDFSDKRHEIIFSAILKLYNQRKAIDVLTLANILEANNQLTDIGGPEYLTQLTNYVPSSQHIEDYAQIVSQKAIRRKLIRTSKTIEDLGYDETQDTSDIIQAAETALFEVSEQHTNQTIVSIETILAESFDRLDDLHKDKLKIRGLTSGYKDLDDKLAGFQRSDLIIIAARPSMGKTALMLNFAHNVALLTKEPVLYFSLEMSKEQLVDRLLSMESGVDAWALRTGNLSDRDFEKIGEAMGVLSEAPIFIDDTPAITVNELRTKARREAHNHPLGLIIVDYLQLMSGGAKFGSDFNRVQEISEISRGLKKIARELNVPIIAASQLNRSVESRSPQIPQLADLRESGSIEQDADVVAFIYREEHYKPDTERKKITDILIKKHRNGPIGNIELYFDNDKQLFKSLDKKHANPNQNL